MCAEFVPIAPLTGGIEDDFGEIYHQLPSEWLPQRVMYGKIAGLAGFGEVNFTSGRDCAVEMLAAGYLERRVVGSQVQYRPAADPPPPPEPMSALQAQRIEDERKARNQREAEDREFQQQERAREERARPIRENADREFVETAERLLGLTALKSEVAGLRAEVAELRAVVGR